MAERCYTDIGMRDGTHYMVLEKAAEVIDRLDEETVALTTWNGMELMPPVALYLRRDAIAVVREVSEADWIWSKHATALHYERRMRDLETSQTDVLQQMVRTLQGNDE